MPVECQHTIHTAEVQPHVISVQCIDLYILRQRTIGEIVKERQELRIVCGKIQFLRAADVGAARMQGNPSERACEIVGDITSVNLSHPRNVIQFVRAPIRHNRCRRTFCANTPLERTRLCVVCTNVAVVPRAVGTLYDGGVRPHENDLIQRGFRR